MPIGLLMNWLALSVTCGRLRSSAVRFLRCGGLARHGSGIAGLKYYRQSKVQGAARLDSPSGHGAMAGSFFPRELAADRGCAADFDGHLL
eukprot:4859407-Pyramimonas_sp.AAC.1